MPTSQQAPLGSPPRKTRRVWRIVFGIVAALLLFAAAWLPLERYRARKALAKYERQLRAEGEKLTFDELVTPIPEGDNKGPEFVSLCNRLVQGPVLTLSAPSAMKLIGPGRACVLAHEAGWMSDKRFFSWEDAKADLKVNAEILARIREVVRSPLLRFKIDYRAMNTLLPHLAPSKKAAQWFSASSLYHVHIGDVTAAIDDIESIMYSTRTLAEEPFLISQLVRIAMINIALNTCWSVIQDNNSSPEQLLRLQRILEGIEVSGAMVRAFEGERCSGRETVRMLRTHEGDLNQLIQMASISGGDEDQSLVKRLPYDKEIASAIRSAVVIPIWRFAWSYEDERHLLEESHAIVQAARAARQTHSLAAMDNIDRAMEQKAEREFRSWHYWATGLFIPPILKANQRSHRAETQRGMTIAAIALKRYQLKHGRYPSRLEELVPDFLREVPVDWRDGQRLRYRQDRHTFVLWSVGDNGKDDGGSPDQTDPYSFFSGLDLVWPQLATDDELKTYRAKVTPKP